jgi:hypothetical protein
MDQPTLNQTTPDADGNYLPCNPNSMSSGLPIPASLTYYATSTTLDDPGMKACCGRKAVNLIENCYVWCEIPDEFLGNKTNPISEEDVGRAFRDCIEENNGTSFGYEVHLNEFDSPENSAPAVTPGLGKMVLMAGVMYLALL